MQKKYLLAPGPTPVPPEALLAMAMPIIHHRAPDFLPVLDSAKKGLQWLYQTRNDVLILCSTGTGGMVGSVNNFLNPGDDVLVINGGKFGERWTKICQAYGMKVEEIRPIAKAFGINGSKMRKSDLIRAIQQAEGNFPCFGTAGAGDCDQAACRWRGDCLEPARKAG